MGGLAYNAILTTLTDRLLLLPAKRVVTGDDVILRLPDLEAEGGRSVEP